MSDTILTEPIVLDETGQLILAKLDEIVSALNPNAQGVSFDKTGCQIITTNNVQDAVKQLDTGLGNTNASLTNLHAKAYTITKIDGTLTTTETTYNNMQVGGEYRKFSDYDYLLFLLKFSNSDIRDTVLIPAAYWASGSQIARQILHGAGGTTAANYNVSGIISKYNNDTSIKANTTGNNTFTYLEIIGLKIQAN